eukprot:s5196_g4.t1
METVRRSGPTVAARPKGSNCHACHACHKSQLSQCRAKKLQTEDYDGRSVITSSRSFVNNVCLRPSSDMELVCQLKLDQTCS